MDSPRVEESLNPFWNPLHSYCIFTVIGKITVQIQHIFSGIVYRKSFHAEAAYWMQFHTQSAFWMQNAELAKKFRETGNTCILYNYHKNPVNIYQRKCTDLIFKKLSVLHWFIKFLYYVKCTYLRCALLAIFSMYNLSEAFQSSISSLSVTSD